MVAYVAAQSAGEEVSELADVMRHAVAVPNNVDPNATIEMLGLSRQIESQLARHTHLLRDVLLMTESDLLRKRGVGRKSLTEIKEKLALMGMHLRRG